MYVKKVRVLTASTGISTIFAPFLMCQEIIYIYIYNPFWATGRGGRRRRWRSGGRP